jgi:hypothetical protein
MSVKPASTITPGGRSFHRRRRAAVLVLVAVNLLVGTRLGLRLRSAPEISAPYALARRTLSFLEDRRNTEGTLVLFAENADGRLVRALSDASLSAVLRRLHVVAVVRSSMPPAGTLPAGVVLLPLSALTEEERHGIERWDHWHLFDREGVERDRGDLVRGGLAGTLELFFQAGPDLPGALLVAVSEALERGTLWPPGALPSSAEETVALFVRQPNTSCGSAAAIDALQRVGTGRRLLLAVPASWSEDDISAFRWTFDVAIPVYRISESFTQEWEDLSHRFGTERAGAFVAVYQKARLRTVATTRVDVFRILRGLQP